MKELSIEEKAQRYDEAIKRLEDIKTGKSPKPFIFTEGLFDYIFPELKESEDERMIQYFKDLAPFDKADELYEKYGFSHKDAIAWLEKQGEQKPQGKSALEAINEEKVDNANKVEPMQEKLTEFEKFGRAVKQVMEEAIECGDTRNLKADADMLLSLVHNSSWSEDDEEMLNSFLHKLEVCDLLSNKEGIWIKNKLKALRPQNTWKPSNEQMKFLWKYAEQNNYDGRILSSLYEGLKKLKG